MITITGQGGQGSGNPSTNLDDYAPDTGSGAPATGPKPGVPPIVPGRITVQSGATSTSTPVYTGTYGYAGGDGTYGSPRPTAAYETTLVDSYNLPSGVSNPYMTQEYRNYLDDVAVALGTSNSTGSALWQKAIDASQAAAANGQNITPYQIIQMWVADANANPDSPGGGRSNGGGGGGGSATSSQTQYSNRADISDLSNAIAQEMLGRGVTDRELDRIMKRIRRMEANNPTVVTVDAAGNRVVQDGASAASRQDVVERVLANNPEYMPFQKATTLMDWFDSALQERLARSGG